MNIHLMLNEKFASKFIELIDEKYPKDSNIVYIYGNEGRNKDIISPNVKYIDDFSEVELNKLENSDKFFVHGFYWNSVIRYLYRIRKNFDSHPLVLIIWGADLYDAKYKLSSSGVQLKLRIHEYLKKIVIRKACVFMTFASPDYELAEKWYGAKGKQFDCLYPSNANIDLLDELKKESKYESKTRILLGNSATQTNLHFEALDMMKHFADENIEILCPLSYGDMKYGKEVEQYGKSLFGDKFVPIKDYMSPEDYSRLLNSVDVAVFNHNRQQGTGNIEIIGYLGKKLYIRSDTTTWGHYVLRDKCAFYDSKKIGDMDFQNFIEITEQEKTNNENYFKQIWDLNYVKSLWDQVMDYK